MVHVIPLSIAQRRLDAGNAPQYPQGSPIGGATQGFGDHLSAAAERYQQMKDQQEAFDAELARRRFDGQIAQVEDEVTANAPADGAGLHEAMYGQVDPYSGRLVKTGLFDKLFAAALPNMPESQRANFAGQKEAMRQTGGRRMAARQLQRRRDYEQAEVDTALKTSAIAIGNANPDDHVTFKAARQQGLDLIDKMGLDPMGFDRKLPLPWAVADQEAKQYVDPSAPFNKRFARASSIVLAIRDSGVRKATAEQFSVAAEAQWRARAARDPSMTPELLEAQLTALREGLAWIGEHPAQAQYSTMSSLQQFGLAFGDIGRIIAKGATAGGADALVAKLMPSGTGEGYEDRLKLEQAATEDAEDRAGSAGWVAEALGAGLSGYGAATGLYGILGRAEIGVAAEGGLTGLGVRTGIGATTGGAYGGAYAYNVGGSVPQGVLDGALWGAGGNVLAEGLAAIGRQVVSGLANRVAVAKPRIVPDSEPTPVPPVKADEISVSPNQASEIRRPYAHLEDPPNVAPGQDFTRAQKLKMAEENRKWNGGFLRDDEDGQELIPAKKSERGVKPPPNEAQFDHIDPLNPADPNKHQGTNSYSNASLASRRRNRKKLTNKVSDNVMEIRRPAERSCLRQ
ncbi:MULTISPECIES: hypothetical protein [Mesorhizobium]|uniref:hypothetical protein n=1 Tax=Mesorhizobium TaxID=68287 RepID=UPI001864F33B|nr:MULTISPECIES: hypothetical protein [Mesorhizobium]